MENKNILNNFVNFSRCLEDSFHLLYSQKYKNGNLGEFFSLARRLYEKEIEPAYLELPFSQVCNSDGFLSFFLEIAQNIEIFFKIYNKKLEEYRKLFKIRNQANSSSNLIIKKTLSRLPFGFEKMGAINVCRRKFSIF